MSQSIVLGCRGMLTDANQLTTAPTGAMIVARNVMIRRDNVIEPRPGFPVYDGSSAAPGANHIPVVLIEWGPPTPNNFVVISKDTATSNTYDIRYSNNTVISGIGATSGQNPLNEDTDYHRSVVARKNLYITSDAGLCKLESGSDATATHTVPQMGQIDAHTINAISPAQNWAESGTSINYAVVYRKEDSNKYIVRSAPSPIKRFFQVVTASTPSLTTRAAELYIPLPHNAVAGDVIEVYCSEPQPAADPVSTTRPVVGVPDSVELAFRDDIVITSSHITAGYIAYTDSRASFTVPLGANLYTNAGAEGPNNAKFSSEPCSDTALFSSCTWLGNIQTRPRKTYYLKSANLGTDVTDWSPSQWLGVKERDTDTAIAIGNTTVSIVAGPTANHIRPGMILTEDGGVPGQATGVFAAGTAVVSFNPVNGDVVFTPAAIGTLASGENLRFHDVVRIDGTDFYASDKAGSLIPNSYTNNTFDAKDQFATAVGEWIPGDTTTAYEYGAGTTNEELVAANLANVVTTVLNDTVIAGAEFGSVTFSRALGTSSMTIACTSNEAFYPPLPVWPAAETVAAEDHVNRVWYSLPEEPEAFPLGNFIDIGAQSARVLRILSLRDSLLVFKDDGIWRISGSPPNSWRVDQISTDCYLVNARMLTSLDELAYAWTTKGVVTVTPYGEITNISDVPVGMYFRGMLPSVQVTTEAGIRPVHAFTNDRFRIVCFQGPSYSVTGDLPHNSRQAWCFCPITQAWFQWDMRSDGTSASLYHQHQRRIFLGRRNGTFFEIRGERVSSDEKVGTRIGDDTYTITIATASGTSITIPSGTAYTPQIGDQVVQSSARYYIRTVASGTSFTVDRAGLTAASASFIEAERIVCQWAPFVPGSPHQASIWREYGIHLQDMNSLVYSDVEFRTGGSNEIIDSDSALQLVTSLEDLDNKRARTYRAWLPRNIARSNKLVPYFETSLMATYMTINGLTVIHEPVSERLLRRLGA